MAIKCDQCGKFRKLDDVKEEVFSNGMPEPEPIYVYTCNYCEDN